MRETNDPDNFITNRNKALASFPETCCFCVSCGKPETSTKQKERCACGGSLVKVSKQDDYRKHTGGIFVTICDDEAARGIGEKRKVIGNEIIRAYSYALIKQYLGGKCRASEVLSAKQLENLKLTTTAGIYLA